MHGRGKSDGRVLPAKSANVAPLRRKPGSQGEPYTGTQGETPDTAKGGPKAERPRGDDGAESVEGRRPAKGNTDRQNAHRTQSRTRAPSALDRVRRVAARQKDAKFTALLHHVTVDRLREAFLNLKRNAAAGVDGVRWEHYARGLEGSLRELHARVPRGAYRAKPSRRVYILKADGRQRPLGIAALEDKIVQRTVVEVMSAIYEADFLGFSYGFRPGRNQHQALDALAVGILRKKVNWVLDADIRGFFDTIDHGWLMKVRRAPDRGPAGPSPHPQVVEGGGDGRGRVASERGGLTAGGDGVAPAGECLPPLTSTTFLTCGSSNGGVGKPVAT